MNRSVKSLHHFTIAASDGNIGRVKEFYFDDHSWTIRYIVIETGNWLSGRKVLLSPQAITKTDGDNEAFTVNLTKDQIENSPDINTEQPVSRQQEMELYKHYPWTNYWEGTLWETGMGTTGMVTPLAAPLEEAIKSEEEISGSKEKGDPHLRSTANVENYSIHATDGEIGDVEDFIVDETSWKLSFFVVDTGNWFPGKKVLISPEWIKKVEWETSSVHVNASVDNIKNSPEYDADKPIVKDYQNDLHNYYRGLKSS